MFLSRAGRLLGMGLLEQWIGMRSTLENGRDARVALRAHRTHSFIHSFVNEGNEFVENRGTSPTPNEEKIKPAVTYS